MKVRVDEERFRIHGTLPALEPRVARDQEPIPWDVERIDPRAVVRVEMLVAELGVDESPSSFVVVPDLGHLVVQIKTRDEVGGEAHASSGRDGMLAEYRQMQDGEVATAAEDAVRWMSFLGERSLVEFKEPPEHSLRVPGVDFPRWGLPSL